MRLHFSKLLLSALPETLLPSHLPTSLSGIAGKTINGTPLEETSAQEAELSATPATVLAVGEYLVGDTEDTLLNGHPDIRY
ncbi:hypothetical protein [Hymenobacter cellulosilyticus]|uniref:Uncharacterized protein n=1 Tax=Hymenobacter cellulosilyticus TaxID=2932248 RepID=A0A8T9QB21_9BACT|nr:hypothetical protein [Hymenobacter cellulosilyticus]UOQ73581.1 hypothetical protein MUN79_06530 [Hymenobacter cellulosilyticus]